MCDTTEAITNIIALCHLFCHCISIVHVQLPCRSSVCLQLRLWLPEITGKPVDTMVADHLLAALSGPMLPLERRDGWILATQRSDLLRSDTMRAQLAAVIKLLDYVMTDSVALGVDTNRWAPLVNVS